MQKWCDTVYIPWNLKLSKSNQSQQWFDWDWMTSYKIYMILVPILCKIIQCISMMELRFTGFLLFIRLFCGQIRKSRQRSVQRALPKQPSWEFIFGKSYWPQHSTYPVQNRHRVAWQLPRLPNPAGSQSEPANTQHDGVCTQKKKWEIGLAIWWQQPISMRSWRGGANICRISLAGKELKLVLGRFALLTPILVESQNKRCLMVTSNHGVFTHPLRLLRMEAMPMTMLATDRAFAAFLRANSLMWSPVAWSLRKSLLVHWKKPETTQHGQLVVVRVRSITSDVV